MKKTIGLLMVAALWLAWAPTVPAGDKPRTIQVAGQGRAVARPDVATVQTGVVTRGETAAEALAVNNRQMESVMAVLAEQGIAAKDIQTAAFEVTPEYRRDDRGRTQPEIAGYQVHNQLRVRIRRLDDLGAVLDSLVRNGSNRLGGVSFGIDDPEAVQNAARQQAVGDALRRAELYARAAGVLLGRILSISEQPVEAVRPAMQVRTFAAEAAGNVPLASGELEFQSTIHVRFEIDDP